MKAVMYGAGNIGRGFVGALFSKGGYHVTFIDVSDAVVQAINSRGKYPVRYVSAQGHEDEWIGNVSAVNGNDTEAAAQAIATCDLMATAVGVRALEFIGANIAAGFRRRMALGGGPLNIIICENLIDAQKVLADIIKRHLNEEEQRAFDAQVGLVEASIGRMVPVQTEEMKDGDPLRVCVERYGHLPVDGAAFKGGVPEIPNLYPADPFDYYVKRKLYLHNMSHAVCAYLGGYAGKTYIWEAIEDADILCMVHSAMLESAAALSGQYGVPLDGLLLHVDDLLCRFRNRALMDTCARVGGDPMRKLGANDRLIGAARMIAGQGTAPAWITVGIAAALYRLMEESHLPKDVAAGVEKLCAVAGIAPEDKLTADVAGMYARLCRGESLTQLRNAAQDLRAAGLGDIL